MPVKMTQEEFEAKPIEEKRQIIRQLEFEAKPIEEKQAIIRELEGAEQTGAMEAFARGAAQGLTFNHLDEIIGFVKGAASTLNTGRPFSETREFETEMARTGFRKAERDQPGASLAGNITGMIPSLVVPGGAAIRGAGLLGTAARVGAGAGLGGIAAAGKTEAPIGSPEFAEDVAGGLTTGAVAQGAAQALTKAGKVVIGKGGEITRGVQRRLGRKGEGRRATDVDESGLVGRIRQDIAAKKGTPPGKVVISKGEQKRGIARKLASRGLDAASVKALGPLGPIFTDAAKRVAKNLVPGLNRTKQMLDKGTLPARFANRLNDAINKRGGAGLAAAYMDLVNEDLEFSKLTRQTTEADKTRGGLGQFIPGFEPDNKSTFGGRVQTGLDALIGAESIGLDPGEKAPKSQPNPDDIAAMVMPLFAGMTKVTKLDISKRIKLLEKKGEKLSNAEKMRLETLENIGEHSPETQQRILSKINKAISKDKPDAPVKDMKDEFSSLNKLDKKLKKFQKDPPKTTEEMERRINDSIDEIAGKNFKGERRNKLFQEGRKWAVATEVSIKSDLQKIKKQMRFMEKSTPFTKEQKDKFFDLSAQQDLAEKILKERKK